MRRDDAAVGRVVVDHEDLLAAERRLDAAQVAAGRERALGDRRPDREAELAADPDLAGHADPAAHQLGQPLADRQAETGAPVAARRRGVDLAERLEEPAEPVGRDADAGVPDGEGQLGERPRAVRTVGRHRQDHLAPLGELDRVREQVQEHLAEARHVPDDRGGGAVADQIGEVEPLLGGAGGHEIERGLDALAEVERLGLELELPRLDLGEVEDVVDDGQERVAALADDLRVLALLVVQGRSEEEPAHPDHGVHRGPDLVAHRRQEGALRLVGRLGLPAGAEEVGDVVVDPDHAHPGAVDDHGHRRDLDVHRGAVLPGAPADRADPFPPERPVDVGADLGAGLRRRDEVLHGVAEGFRLRVTEEPLGPGVPAHDPAAEVDGHDRHRARLDDRVRVLLPALDLPEEPGVVDGQHRLGGEGPHRPHDLRREGAHLPPEDDQAAEEPVFPDERQREERAQALPDQDVAYLGGDELALSLDVRDRHGLPDHARPADRPLAEADRRLPDRREMLRRDLVRGPHLEPSARPRRTRRRSRCGCRRARRPG